MFKKLFSKEKIPKRIPEGMLKAVSELNRCRTKETCLKKAYDIMTKRFFGSRAWLLFRFHRIFIDDVDYLWHHKGMMICVNTNLLLRILLVKSRHFNESDIKKKWTLYWFISPHQYIKVRTEPCRWVNIDIWGAHYGITLGDYCHGFHTSTIK